MRPIIRQATTRANDVIRCSFCGKGQDVVARMILASAFSPGSGVAICDDCVRLCNDLLDGANSPPAGATEG